MPGIPKWTATLAWAAVLAAAGSQPAAAQQARYCDGALVANAFYRNVLPGPGGAEVEYHGQFQNQDPLRRRLFAALAGVQGAGPSTRLELGPYEQVDVVLLRVRVGDEGGQGASPPEEVGRTVRLTCRFGP